ncbi:MAG TPA: hypothetical protein VFG39_08310 [Balneolaceae bacterium]|nr:hypothetical protein [Balneolaceae bacterium]
MRRIFLIAISAIFVLQACAPEPVLRLKSQAEEQQTSYYQGIEYVYQQKDSVEVIVSYYKHSRDLFMMTVEVFNNSNRVVRINPAAFAYKAYEGENPEKVTKFLSMAQAKNPEEKMLAIDMELSRQRADQKADNTWFFIAQGLTFVGGATADTYEEREDAAEQFVANTIVHQADREEFHYDQYSLKQQRKVWRLDALRITDLLPGENVRGIVFFSTNPDAELYDILINLEDLQFDFWFRQIKYYP